MHYYTTIPLENSLDWTSSSSGTGGLTGRKFGLIVTSYSNSIMIALTNSCSDFICSYWGVDHCDPNSWSYSPSTYDVDDVEIVDEPHMKAWSDLKSWINPGRADGVDYGKVDKLGEDIKENGIKTDCQMIYYDVDTNERINGEHREMTSRNLDIPGWMMVGVRFKTEQSKIRFALVSNKKKPDIFNPIKSKDVEATVRELMSLIQMTDEEIKKECRDLGKNAIGKPEWERIHNRLIAERRLNGKCDGAERLYEWNEHAWEEFVKKSDDPWLEDYYNNDSEITLYINEKNWDSRIGSTISAADEAASANKPLHIVIGVKLRSNEELGTTRKKILTDRLKSLGRKIANIYGLDYDRHSGMLPWNHPDCEHRFLPQDSLKENAKELIKISN